MSSERKVVVSALNATLRNEDGSTLTDLFGANGTVLLGHCNPAIVKVLQDQAARIWISGRLETDIRRTATELVQRAIPRSHYVAGFYSTGMEAAEFAIRAARVATGRKDLVGFAKSMHGKSMATAFLAWDSDSGYPLPGVARFPFPSADRADQVLADVETVLARGTTAAVFLEAIQGSGGGAIADRAFCRELTRLCREHGTLLVADEILTGFHRTGPRFFHTRLELDPDIILAGKCIGNGFPVSVVMLRNGIGVTPGMLPYSTYAENALAAAAIVGTLTELGRSPVEEMVLAIERTIAARLQDAAPERFQVSGVGALWILLAADAAIAGAIADRCYENGVLISQAGPMMRLLPPVTIPPDQLSDALDVLCQAMRDCAA